MEYRVIDDPVLKGVMVTILREGHHIFSIFNYP